MRLSFGMSKGQMTRNGAKDFFKLGGKLQFIFNFISISPFCPHQTYHTPIWLLIYFKGLKA